MPKTIDEIKRAPFPVVVEVECDHEQRIAALEQRMAIIEALFTQDEAAIDAAWLDEWQQRVRACRIRQP